MKDRFSGTAELSTAFDESKNHIIAGEYEITDVNKKDNNDGSFTYTYKAKPVKLMELKEGGKKVIIKTKGSHSQRLRGAIWHLNPDEEYYGRVMNEIIKNIESIIKFIDI